MTRTLIAASLLALSSLALAGDKADKTSKKDTFLPTESLTWVAPFGPQGPEFSYVQGDPKTGPYQAFLRMGTGTAGWHTHDAAYSAVVVQGTWAHLYQGETAVTNLAPGSFWTQAGGGNHDDRCVAGPCVIFIVSQGAQTYHPKTADGKDVPAQPK